MRKKYLLVLSIILLLVGLCVIFYPTVSQFFNNQEMKNTVETFKKDTEEFKDDSKTNPSTPTSADSESNSSSSLSDNNTKYTKPQLDRLYKDMVNYNIKLSQAGGQDAIADPFAYSQPSFDLSSYGIQDSIFGYISIPEINLEMPIYLGANSTNMWYGAAHMTYTSVPIGGISTNSVLVGHRGVANKTMFDNIVFLKEGDMVTIGNFWGELNYKVIKYEVISPTDMDKVLIQKDKDLLTLVTCHPYGYSDQRYIVVCQRVY